MKFLMSKRTCVPKTTHDFHKELCRKPDLGRSKYELLGPSDKYRDEYAALYSAKCEEFKMKSKKIQDANVKAMSNNRPKLGEMYKMMLRDVDLDENNTLKEEQKSELKLTSRTSISSLGNTNIRETGVAIRKRHERYYKDVWDVNDRHCYFDPWFRRYLILCRFISAGRKIILINRMLKRLAVFKSLRHNKELIPFYEDQYIKIQHLSYPHIFARFDPI